MSAANVAVLFPGQGSYFPGAWARLQHEHNEARSVFVDICARAEPILDQPVADLLGVTPQGTDERSIDEWLAQAPEILQLAIYGVSVATYQVLRSHGLRPDVLIGHSLGEVAALAGAGAFSVADGAEIVCHRSLALQQVGGGDGYMAAVGLDASRAERMLGLIGDPMTAVAAENHPVQTVLSGRAEALDTAARISSALRVSFGRIKSPYPFHSPLLEEVTADFEKRIRHIRFEEPKVRVYSPIMSRAYRQDEDLVESLANHLVRRVRFTDAIRHLHDEEGVRIFVESGALDILTRMVQRVVHSPDVLSVAPLASPSSDGQGMQEAIGRLVDAGVAVRSPGELEDLRRTLLPDVAEEAFDRFWRSHGRSIVDYVRQEFATLSVAAPAVGPALTPVGGDGTSVGGEAAGGGGDQVLPTDPPGREDLLRALASTYAEALEYPAEVFGEDTDLEAELGVDSVKQTELLTRVSDQYGLPPRPSSFRVAGYNTLGKIADLVLASSGER